MRVNFFFGFLVVIFNINEVYLFHSQFSYDGNNTQTYNNESLQNVSENLHGDQSNIFQNKSHRLFTDNITELEISNGTLKEQNLANITNVAANLNLTLTKTSSLKDHKDKISEKYVIEDFYVQDDKITTESENSANVSASIIHQNSTAIDESPKKGAVVISKIQDEQFVNSNESESRINNGTLKEEIFAEKSNNNFEAPFNVTLKKTSILKDHKQKISEKYVIEDFSVQDDKPIIVNPKGSKHDEKLMKQGPSKVVANSKNLQKVKELRDEINQAVEENKYSVTLPLKNITTKSDNSVNASASIIHQNSTDESPKKGVVVQSKIQNEPFVNTNENLNSNDDNITEPPLLGADEVSQLPVTKNYQDINNENITDANEPIVVNPESKKNLSTLPSENLEPNLPNHSVIVTEEKLLETAAIRQEIQDAIDGKRFVVAETNELDLLKIVDSFHKANSRMKSYYSTLGLDDTDEDLSGHEHNNIKDFNNEELLDTQVIESRLGKKSDLKFRTTNFVPKQNKNREVLTLTHIREDVELNFGEDVTEWQVLRINKSNILIGIKNDSILLMKLDSKSFKRITFNGTITKVESFICWNSKTALSKGLVLIAINETIHWIDIDNGAVNWSVYVGMKISALKYFQIRKHEYLAILVNKSSSDGLIALILYEFKFDSKELWLKQEIPLEYDSNNLIFLNTGRDIILGVSQLDYALIFKYNPDENYLNKFENIIKIQSEGLTSLAAFKMGGYSYVAISGMSPKILRYHRGHFIPQTILGENFGLVEYFVPIPARTYRDDLLLLVQHKIGFDTHSVSVVEALVWDGVSFEVSEMVPCYIKNMTSELGVNCLLDPTRDSGIQGSAVFQNDKSIFIIVPRIEATSGIFRFYIELSEKDNELEELDQIFRHLKNMFEQQTNLTNDALEILNSTHRTFDLALNNVEAPELYIDGDVEEIFLNDIEWTETDSKIDLEELIDMLEEIETLTKSRHKRNIFVDNIIEADNVEVDILEVLKVNNENMDNMFVIGDSLFFNGTIIFENDLNVTNSFNIQSNSESRSSEDAILETEAVTIDGNFKFKSINGIDWEDFLRSISITMYPIELKDVEIQGNVVIDEGLNISNVNNLSFPDEYLWSSGQDDSIVSANKTFLNKLITNDIDTAGGLINGVDPFDLITLSDDQNITAHTTFTQLEVSTSLEVNGSVSAKGLTSLLDNPSLLTSNLVQSSCDFKNLEVNGLVVVAEKFNGQNLDNIFSDLVYKTDNEVIIKSKKLVHSGNLTKMLTKNLNEIPLEEFVLNDSTAEQDLSLSEIIGNVYVNNLKLDQLFNSINTIELMKNLILLDDDFIDLTFNETLHARDLLIHHELNNKPIQNFRTVYDNFEIGEAEFESLSAENLKSDCNITGNNNVMKGKFFTTNLINGIKMDQFIANFKTTETITDDLFINELILDDGLYAKNMNGISSDHIMAFLKSYDIHHMIKSGLISMEKLIIHGNVHLNYLNDQNFEKIKGNVIWLNRPNFFSTPFKFTHPVIVQNLQISEHFNEKPFPELVSDIIYRDNDLISIYGLKIFLNSVIIFKNTLINNINNIPFESIAMKNSPINFKSSINILGSLTSSEINIGKKFNEMESTKLKNLCKYDKNYRSYVIESTVRFTGNNVRIKNLRIDGNLNDFHQLNEHLDSLIYKNHPMQIYKANIIFKNQVKFTKGAYIRTLNSLNLTELFENLINVNQVNEIVMPGFIVFKDHLLAENVQVMENLITPNIFNCNLNDLIKSSVRIDEKQDLKSLNFANGSLDGNHLDVKYFNEHNTAELITLHTSQNLTGKILFSKVILDGEMKVQGKVNKGLNFTDEKENTLMNHGHQEIYSLTTMKSFEVIESLNILPLINGKNLSNCAILNSNIQLRSPISIKKLQAFNLETSDHISGLDFKQWYTNSVWLAGKRISEITGNWSIGNLTTYQQIYGNKLVNNRHLDEIFAPENFNELNNNFPFEYQKLCALVKSLIEKNQSNNILMKYFEHSYKLFEKRGSINRIYMFNHRENTYLLVNSNCFSSIFHWKITEDGDRLQINRITDFESGLLENIYAIPEDLNIILTITSSFQTECQTKGMNNWSFNLYSVNYTTKVQDQYSDIHYFDNNFYGVKDNDHSLINIDTSEKWELPTSAKSSYQFLPSDLDIGSGLALSDGERLLIIDTKCRKRYQYKSVEENQNFTFQKDDGKIFLNDPLKNSEEEPILSSLKILFKNISQQNSSRLTNNIEMFFAELNQLKNNLKNNQTNIVDNKESFMPESLITNTNQFENISNVIKTTENLLTILSEIKLHYNNQTNLLNFLISNISTNLQSCQNLVNGKTRSIIFEKSPSSLDENLKINQMNQSSFQGTVKSLELSEEVEQMLDIVFSQLKLCELIEINFTNFTKNEKLMSTSTERTSVGNLDNLYQYHSNITDISQPELNESTNEPIRINLMPETILGTRHNEYLLIADNPHFPGRKSAEEILALKIQSNVNHRTLIAVTETKSRLNLNISQDSIKIYSDIIQGDLFQTISANRPRCLTILHIGDNIVFAFVENNYVVNIMIYRGIEGFVELAKFETKKPVTSLASWKIESEDFLCPKYYLLVVSENVIDFYEAIYSGNCLLETMKLNCDL